MGVALDPASGKPGQKKKTVPPLSAYGIDIRQTSVFGGVVGRGHGAADASFALVDHARGRGYRGFVTYDGANLSLVTSALRLAQGLFCLPGDVDYAQVSLGRTAAVAGVLGAIDDPAATLPRQRVCCFPDVNDGSVRRRAMNTVTTYYRQYARSGNATSGNGNVYYQTDNRASDALITTITAGRVSASTPSTSTTAATTRLSAAANLGPSHTSGTAARRMAQS
jgi:hypothetical protein